ncbi:thermonuclease family protein [Nitrosospira sp. Is2]|nr:thermonuclease family protein [Nitrosospira sp. Is2]WON72762.1 thermonuclease family protein [Nitrosospira sp. Is2]
MGIADGDTLTVLTASRQQHKIRLAEIDAPEKDQPFGTNSKQSLTDLCFGKEAEVIPQHQTAINERSPVLNVLA